MSRASFAVPEGIDPAQHFATLLHQMNTRCTELEAQVAQQARRATNVQPTPSAPPVSGGRRRLPDPERFTGKRDGVRAFVEKIDNVIAGESASFVNDDSRRAYMVSLLSGDAYLWYSNFASNGERSPEGLLILSYQELRMQLLAAFRDSDEEATAQRKLAGLRQLKSSAQEYANKFRQYAY